MHADRLQLLTPGIGDCGFAAVGEHDRRAISGVQGKQLLSRRHLRHIGLREQGVNVLGSDRLDVSDAAVAELGQRLGDISNLFSVQFICVHGAQLLSYWSSPFLLIVLFDRNRFNTRSGSGRTRSIDSNPFFRSAPDTSIPSASTTYAGTDAQRCRGECIAGFCRPAGDRE